MPQLTRRQYRAAVQALRPFRGNSVYSEKVGDLYVVYSYGKHFPLFAHKGGKWFENSDRYSMTTSHHRSYCHPLVETTKLDTGSMKALIGS